MSSLTLGGNLDRVRFELADEYSSTVLGRNPIVDGALFAEVDWLTG
ncbi:hypothetical protein [Streptomyces paradoxus]|uniref:Uncharacterized protein n=1 Tax=Streptomyces paradoxus TaxID=66375 RepID=A0A7W9TF44_9ACTN|nr:hypothetical protein [Streptomyces paradoxus]MBB6078823.1 hypothetical protein [Streptomyces paradoxus]